MTTHQKTLNRVNGSQHTFTLEEIMEADSEGGGFCLHCRAYASSIEPDARNYACDECDRREVFGAGEIALMGLVK